MGQNKVGVYVGKMGEHTGSPQRWEKIGIKNDHKFPGLRFYIGGIIVSSVVSVSSYFVLRSLLKWMRRRKKSTSNNS